MLASSRKGWQDHAAMLVFFYMIEPKQLTRIGSWKIVLTAAVLCGYLPVHAQVNQPDSITGRVHDIPNVTIEARRAPNRVSSNAPVQTLSRSTIEDLGIQDIADAVRRFAGTEVKDYGGTGGLKTVSVRNMGAAHTAISYDGIAVSNCQAGQIDIGRFSLDNVASLSLSVGQSDDLLQSARMYASAGVLNIETERPRLNDGKNWQLKAQLKGGSFGYVNPYLRYSHRLGKRTIASIDADYLRSDGQYPFILQNGKYTSEEKRYNSEVDSWHTEANLFHEFGENSRLDVKGYYYQSDRGLPGAVILYNPNSQEHLWDKNGFIQARLRHRISDRWAFQEQAKYNYSWNKYQDKGAQYEGGVSTDRYTQHEYYASGTVLYQPLTGLSISLAQDVAVNTLSSTLPDCPFPTRFTSLTALQVQYRYRRFKFGTTWVNTWITEHVKEGERPDDLKKISPTVSLSWQPWESQPLYLRAMYKNTFRTPTFNDLYYYRMGNRSLRPEKATEYNLGITWSLQPHSRFEFLSVTADGYFNRVTDKIVAFPSTYVWKMANYGKAHITGLDVTLATRIAVRKGIALNLNGNYTWQKAIDLTNPDSKSYKDQLPYTPEHNGSASASLETPWVTVGYSLIGVGKRYYLSQNIPENEIDGYVEQTLSVSRTFRFRTFQMRLQADAVNFTDEQYDIIKFYPMPGRSWKLTANFIF